MPCDLGARCAFRYFASIFEAYCLRLSNAQAIKLLRRFDSDRPTRISADYIHQNSTHMRPSKGEALRIFRDNLEQ
jgi:hypothetical protein